MNMDISLQFKGAAGNQFGKDVYITLIPFKLIDRFLVVFPEVQRKVQKPRIKEIANYVLKGINNNNLSFFSAVTASCRGNIYYDEEAQSVHIDLNAQLSVNDGQHRIEGIKLALKTVQTQLDKATNDNEKEKIAIKLEQLQNMQIPVVIFANMGKEYEQQLFHDLNLLAKRPNKSISLKFDNNDLYNMMAKELVKENNHLKTLGVDTEKTQLKEINPNLMLLSTLRNTISYMISGTDKDKKNVLSESNYEDWKNDVKDAFDQIFQALPQDCNDRTKYIIGLAATIQGIGKYVNKLINNEEILDWKENLKNLSSINWRHDNKMWNSYGGSYDSAKKRFVFSGTGSGINGVCRALEDNINAQTTVV